MQALDLTQTVTIQIIKPTVSQIRDNLSPSLVIVSTVSSFRACTRRCSWLLVHFSVFSFFVKFTLMMFLFRFINSFCIRKVSVHFLWMILQQFASVMNTMKEKRQVTAFWRRNVVIFFLLNSVYIIKEHDIVAVWQKDFGTFLFFCGLLSPVLFPCFFKVGMEIKCF